MAQSYNLYGGNTSLSLIGQYLADEMPDFGPAINELTVTMRFATSPPARETLERLFAEFHASLANLPQVVFRRSREQASVIFQSQLLDGRELHKSRTLSLELFRGGLAEVVDRLALLKSRLKRSDAFDLPGFLAHCEGRLMAAPRSQEALEVLSADLCRKAREASARLSPWEKLGLDWRDFHPDARAILDDPFFWSSGDEFSPNGNDTGADVLGMYRDWRKVRGDRSATEFFTGLLSRWGISLPPESPTSQEVYDEACIALAFAEFKLRAACEPQIAMLAKAAVARQRSRAEAATDWPHREKRLQALNRIASKL
jgi:uncharacterized protein YfeS